MSLINQCILCHNAACSKVCPETDPAGLLRSIKFENGQYAFSRFKETVPCTDCDGHCQKNCPEKVQIKEILLETLGQCRKSFYGECAGDVDLSCSICGVKLENPFILSSSVVASSYEMCARAFEMGWAGICYKTISMMEMHEASPRFSAMKEIDGTFAGFKNIEQLSDHSVEENMECFRRLKKNYPSKVIIASIMGRNEKEWEELARKVTEAGADVIELNFSCPNMEEKDVGVDIGQRPEFVKKFTMAARKGSKLPILAKMTPNITDMRVPARAAMEGGADGIAAINTIKSITDINLETMVGSPAVHGHTAIGGYSGRAVKPIALRFIAEMAQDFKGRDCHLSAMGGVYSWKDAAEFIALGAGSIQITTAVMEYGYRIIDDLVSGLKFYMGTHGINSVEEMKGNALDSIVDTSDVERDTILFPVFHKEECAACGRCYLSCRDGGHQAIKLNETTGKPSLDGSKCVGCHLCILVCPRKAIGFARKRIEKR